MRLNDTHKSQIEINHKRLKEEPDCSSGTKEWNRILGLLHISFLFSKEFFNNRIFRLVRVAQPVAAGLIPDQGANQLMFLSH